MAAVMSTEPAMPPLDGSISYVVPGLVDFHAEHNPDRPWAFLASDSHHPPSWVTFLEFAKATHRVAHALRPGRTGPEKEVVALLINCDNVMYLALIAGMIRAGLIVRSSSGVTVYRLTAGSPAIYQPFPLSPRNSPAAVVNMLKRVECHHMICQPSLEHLLSAVQTQLETEDFALKVDDLLHIDVVFPTLYNKSSDDPVPYPASETPLTMEDIGIYMHSSGSTGFPKPIPQRYFDMLQNCNSRKNHSFPLISPVY
jgi:acyl-coenzyme A synthetase/AMP-(fatty) acid ligase